MNNKLPLRILSLLGILLTLTALAVDWLRTPGFGSKGISLAVLGLLIACAPFFRSRTFENWRLTPARFLAPLMLVAALVNGYLMIKNPNIGGDALWFHSSFHNLVAGKGWTNIYGAIVEPGYGMLAYPFYLLFGSIELSGMLVSASAYLLIIPTTYFTVDYLFGRRSAMLAAWLIAFWPALLSLSYVNLSDVAFALFSLLSFLYYTRVLLDHKSAILRYIILGATLGMAYLLRESEGLIVASLALPGLFVFSLMDLSQIDRRLRTLGAWRTAILKPTSALLVFLAAVVFYGALIQMRTGVWAISTRLIPVFQTYQARHIREPGTPTNAGEVVPTTSTTPQIASGAAATATQPVVPAELPTDTGADTVTPIMEKISRQISTTGVNAGLFRQNLAVLFARVLWMNIHAIAPLAFLWLLYPFIATKKLFSRRLPPDSRPLRLLLALTIFASPLLPLLVSFDRTALRYYLSDFIYILMPVAFLIVRLLTRILESVGKTRFLDFGIVLICIGSLVVSLNFGQPNLWEAVTTRHAHTGLRAAGLWLRDNVPHPDDISILSPRKGQVALFYASGEQFSVEYSDIPITWTLDEISALVNTADFDYLVLDNHYVHQQPHLEALWNNPGLATENGLLLLHGDPEGRFQIYAGGN